jgi:hypothetical protein
MQAYSASRYFCSQVHGRSARQLYPWELTSELVAEEGGNPSAPTFTVAIKPGQQSSLKMDDLAASMPFLFEQPPAVPEKDGKKVEKKKAVYRGKWFASLRRENGKRVPVFGAERVVTDPYIQVSTSLSHLEYVTDGMYGSDYITSRSKRSSLSDSSSCSFSKLSSSPFPSRSLDDSIGDLSEEEKRRVKLFKL